MYQVMLEVSLKIWLEDYRRTNPSPPLVLDVARFGDPSSAVFWKELNQIKFESENEATLASYVGLLRDKLCVPKQDALANEMSFWEKHSDSNDLSLAFYADCQFRMGLREDGIVNLIRLFQRKPEWAQMATFDGLNSKQKGQEQLVLDIRLARLRACLASNKDLDDRIREDYSSLLDEYADRPDLLSKVKSLSTEIVKAENEGRLPRAFVRRTVN